MNVKERACLAWVGDGPGRAFVRDLGTACVLWPDACTAVRASSIGPGGTRGTGSNTTGGWRGDLADHRGHSGRRDAGSLGWAPRLPASSRTHVGGVTSGRASWPGSSCWPRVIMAMGLSTISGASDGGSGWAFSSAWPTGLAVSGIRVTLFGPFAHPLLGGAVTVLWIVGLTNAFNLLDNMDGLAASVGLIAAACSAAHRPRSGVCSCRRFCSCWWEPWRVFWSITTRRRGCSWGMPGAISWGSCSGADRRRHVHADSRGGYSPYSVLAPLLVMAVPLYDMVSVILIRLARGAEPIPGRSTPLLAPPGGTRV